MEPSTSPVVIKRSPRVVTQYVPAVGPRLRVLLFVVFGLFAFLGATGVYLGVVSLVNYIRSPKQLHDAIRPVGLPGPLRIRRHRHRCRSCYSASRHWWTARKRPNRVRRAARAPRSSSPACSICLTGFALIQLEGHAADSDRLAHADHRLLAARHRAGRRRSGSTSSIARRGRRSNGRLPRPGAWASARSPSAWSSCTRRIRSAGSARGRRRGSNTSSPRPRARPTASSSVPTR